MLRNLGRSGTDDLSLDLVTWDLQTAGNRVEIDFEDIAERKGERKKIK